MPTLSRLLALRPTAPLAPALGRGLLLLAMLASGELCAAASYEHLSIRLLHRMGDGRELEAASLSAPLNPFLARPVTLALVVSPVTPPNQKSAARRGEPMGGFGAFGGSAEEAETPQSGLQLAARFVTDGKLGKAETPLRSDCAQPATCVQQSLLRFRLSGGTAGVRTVDRVLLDQDTSRTPGFHRSAITVLNGPVSDQVASQFAAALSARQRSDRQALDRQKAAGDQASLDELLRLDQAPARAIC